MSLKSFISNSIICFLVIFVSVNNTDAQADTSFKLLPGEGWWGGEVSEGYKMPFSNDFIEGKLFGDASENQCAPLLISSRGRWLWSNEPFTYQFNNDSLFITNTSAAVLTGKAGNNLSEAYKLAQQKFFPPSGHWPDSLMVTSPQYNLWIELGNNPTQQKVMDYAKRLLAKGYPPGVLMIDNRWESSHGTFDFDPATFPAPEKMMDSLHAMGFKVMLWICPFISPDGKIYLELSKEKLLLLDSGDNTATSWTEINKPLYINWWDGISACLDLTNPKAEEWMHSKLHYLIKEYGIDGFKFDAGDPYFYTSNRLTSFKKSTPNEHCYLWAKAGLQYRLNEYRAMWKMGGQPLVQRLSDKNHSWHDLQMLIPNTVAQQLLGYTFTAPDMIGGGQINTFNDATRVDQKLFVRSAQCQALMPMMQFSAAPWRVLDATHQQAVKACVDLRDQYLPVIMKVLRESAITGEPALRPLEYNYPNEGFGQIKDQFMIGTQLLIAPVVTAKDTRKVIFPNGKWKYKNKTFKGGVEKEFTAALNELLVFENIEKQK